MVEPQQFTRQSRELIGDMIRFSKDELRRTHEYIYPNLSFHNDPCQNGKNQYENQIAMYFLIPIAKRIDYYSNKNFCMAFNYIVRNSNFCELWFEFRDSELTLNRKILIHDNKVFLDQLKQLENRIDILEKNTPSFC